MVFDVFPFNEPKFKGKISLPNENKKYIFEDFSKKYYIEEIDYKDLNIDIDKLKSKKGENIYSIEELKEIAKMMKIDNYSKCNKAELVKIITSKLKI